MSRDFQPEALSVPLIYLLVGSSSGEGNGTPLQYSRLENPTDGGDWQATYSPWGPTESDTTKGLHIF